MGLEGGDGKALIDLGVRWLRDGVRWAYLEPKEGDCSWAEQDNVVKVANQYGINLLLVNPEVPDWVWKKNRQERKDAVYEFYKALATRYKGKVRYYEIFNEPNLSGMFFPEGKSEKDADYVSTYLDFLAAANKAVHEADSSAVVVLGGLAEPEYAWLNPAAFMKQLYELGGKDCFDVFAYHPYASGGGFKKKAEAIRAALTLYGDSDKPIWFNELGANSAQGQVGLMKQMKNEINAVPAWFWFSLRDFDSSGEGGKYGLLTRDFKKRPAYGLFRQIIKSR